MDNKRPVRRKDKENPYSIFAKDGRFFVTFKDSNNEVVTIEIDKGVFDLFNTFELEDLAHMNEFDRHGEHLPESVKVEKWRS